jgi:uncharacterized protein
MSILIYLLIGLFAGSLSGFLGIGGGIVIVPAFIYMLGMKQHLAQGTSLAMMIPPITFIAAYRYYKHGNVDIWVALFVCMGFVIGAFFGASGAHYVSPVLLKKIFGIFMISIGIKMIFF